METYDWKVAQDEDGLNQVCEQLTHCRAEHNDLELGRGLLALSFLVKWVRSDTETPPFVRSRELALEALDVFRRIGAQEEILHAALASLPFSPPAQTEQLLAEAQEIAEKLPDETFRGLVWAAKARTIALRDPDEAEDLNDRAIAIFRRTGNKANLAQSLFSRSIAGESDANKRDAAIEAAQLYRKLGDFSQACRCTQMAILNSALSHSLLDIEPLIRQGLEDAYATGEHRNEGYYYGKLAEIAESKGDTEEAAKYRRWRQDIEESDGRTPLERWQDQFDCVELMLMKARIDGDKDTAKQLRKQLKDLKATKPAV